MHRLGKGNAHGNQHRASRAAGAAVEIRAGNRRLRSGNHCFGDIVSAYHQQFLGFALALIGTIACVKGRKSGKGLSIAGVVMNVIAFAVVLATQSIYSSAVDDALSGTSVAPQPATTAPASDDDADDAQATAAGNSITLKNGLVLTVDGVVTGLQNYDGTPIAQVSVTYQNNGNSQASFNPCDWKAEDAQGAQRSQAFYTDGDNELHSGTLAAGGTVSGNLYFEGDVVKVLYENAFIGRGSYVSWDIV